MPAEDCYASEMLAALVLAALTAPSTGLATIRYDAPPPNFAFPTAHGTEYLSDLRGRVVIIDFWATWCHVCTAELKDFVRARETFGNRVAIVTVSDELPDVAASYLRLSNISLPLVEDLEGAVFTHLLGLRDSRHARPRPKRRRHVRVGRRLELGGACSGN